MENYLSVNFQYLIKKMNCSQDEFGSMFGLNRGNVGQYIREVSVPKLDTLLKISEYFDVTLDELVKTDLSTSTGKLVQPNVATKQNINTPSTDKDALIAAQIATIESQKETIETQKELIATLRSQLNRTQTKAS